MQNIYWNVLNRALILLVDHIEKNRAQESKKLPFIMFQVYPHPIYEGKL